jgi:signal peptidase II
MMKRWVILLMIVLAVLGIDQLSKEWVINTIPPYTSTEPIPALSPFFRLTHSFNTGAAFGMLPDAGNLFLVLAVVIVGVMLLFYWNVPLEGWPTRAGIAMIIGGALGNVVDRLRHGHVTDFVHFTVGDIISNVSNLADHAIVLGVIIILIDGFRLERIEKQQANAQSATTDDIKAE